MNRSISVAETSRIMRESQCILDTDRESQTGTTPRLIWALAMGKKVVTTNRNITNFEFYSPRQIAIIDRDNPIIPLEFIETPLPPMEISPSIAQLRIDRWVNTILNQNGF